MSDKVRCFHLMNQERFERPSAAALGRVVQSPLDARIRPPHRSPAQPAAAPRIPTNTLAVMGPRLVDTVTRSPSSSMPRRAVSVRTASAPRRSVTASSNGICNCPRCTEHCRKTVPTEDAERFPPQQHPVTVIEIVSLQCDRNCGEIVSKSQLVQDTNRVGKHVDPHSHSRQHTGSFDGRRADPAIVHRQQRCQSTDSSTSDQYAFGGVERSWGGGFTWRCMQGQDDCCRGC